MASVKTYKQNRVSNFNVYSMYIIETLITVRVSSLKTFCFLFSIFYFLNYFSFPMYIGLYCCRDFCCPFRLTSICHISFSWLCPSYSSYVRAIIAVCFLLFCLNFVFTSMFPILLSSRLVQTTEKSPDLGADINFV